jgi:hypothetical protein
MTHWYLKIPRFDGRKTLAFNGFILIASCSAQIWLVAGGSPLPLPKEAFAVMAVCAAVNCLLRMVTERPVWWRQLSWSGFDLAQGESETVYHKASEFVASSDFTDWRESKAVHRDAQHYGTGVMEGGKHVPLANFYRDLDERLVDTREAFEGQFYGNGPHVLPLDEERERH